MLTQCRKNNVLSRTTILIAAGIIISAAFARQLMELLKPFIGREGFIFLVWFSFAFCMFFLLRRATKVSLPALAALSFILFAGISVLQRINIIEERIHVVEYELLGYFAYRDLRQGIKGICYAALVVFLVGIADELFQGLLPYRYFDARDIFFNGLGGILGVSMCLAAPEK